MSAYNPPSAVSTLFNSNNFQSSGSTTCNVIVQAPTITAGNIQSLPPSGTQLAQATCSITGNSPNYVLNLGIPQGVQGQVGPAITFGSATASSLPSNSQPTATVSPTPSVPNSYNLAFGIPQSQFDPTAVYNFSGNDTFGGNNTFSGANTFGPATTTFSGTTTFSNNMTISNNKSL